MNRATLIKILDLARWAPSGDNTQPWRFEIVTDQRVLIKGFDTRGQVIYDFDGHASHMAHGALLETIRIAASSVGQLATWSFASDDGDHRPVYDVVFSEQRVESASPLADFIETRAVQRRPMRITPLSDAQRLALCDAAGEGFSVQFFESWNERTRIAGLLWDNAYLRLTCPEAFHVHQEIIEWGARYSKDRIPELAVGVDPVTAKLMKWVMQKWERVEFFNRYLMGTIAPRIQLDVLPALFCAAHVLLRPSRPQASLNDWLQLGAAMQRVWLTATQQGLFMQPEMTPVIFRWYARSGRHFSKRESLFANALELAKDFEHLAGATEQAPFGFFGRVGYCKPPKSRSVRQDLSFLLQ